MLNTNTQIKKIVLVALFAIFALPTIASAGSTGYYGEDSWGGSGLTGWGGDSYGYSYTPNYSYIPSYSGGSSYSPSYYSGSSYTSPSYGSYYSTPSYSGSSVPSSNYNSNANKNNNKNNNKNTNTSSSNSTSSSSAVAINNNVNNNNVYVYTNPTGNAVVYNPQHQYLNVYCVITPSNPKVGQSVTATAYATGGVGNYSYTWGGDVYSASGPSTTFTSFTPGTKNITVTVRSDQEIITKSCDVVFESENTYNGNLSASCYANPNPANVNQNVTWSVTPYGGNGSYAYSWSGTDGLTGYNQYISKIYGYSGIKTAYVTVSSNGRSVTTSCSTNVNGYNGVAYTGSSVDITPNITSGTPVSGVYLSQLPATGLSLTLVDYLIAAMVIVLASVFTFIYQARKKLMLENA